MFGVLRFIFFIIILIFMWVLQTFTLWLLVLKIQHFLPALLSSYHQLFVEGILLLFSWMHIICATWVILWTGCCVPGQLHIFASNTERPAINDYSEEIEFASPVCFDGLLTAVIDCA